MREEDVPETRHCKYCSKDDMLNTNMELRFINVKQAIYVCKLCDEVYPENDEPLSKDVYDQPLSKSDFQQIGLPEELLVHYPNMKLDFANKIIRVMNNRWKKQLDALWSDFLKLNNNINQNPSCRMIFENDERLNADEDSLFDLTSISEKELKEIENALDAIKKNAFKKPIFNEDDLRPICAEDFFKKIDVKAVNKNKGHMKRLKSQLCQKKRLNLQSKCLKLLNQEKQVLLNLVKNDVSLFHAKFPKQHKEVFFDQKRSNQPSITKPYLSKLLENYRC